MENLLLRKRELLVAMQMENLLLRKRELLAAIRILTKEVSDGRERAY